MRTKSDFADVAETFLREAEQLVKDEPGRVKRLHIKLMLLLHRAYRSGVADAEALAIFNSEREDLVDDDEIEWHDESFDVRGPIGVEE